jgi:hypothetical protein
LEIGDLVERLSITIARIRTMVPEVSAACSVFE